MHNVTVKGARLSLQQARLWSLQEGSQAYCVQCAVMLEGKLQVDALQYALQHLVNQHKPPGSTEQMLSAFFNRPLARHCLQIPFQLPNFTRHLQCTLTFN